MSDLNEEEGKDGEKANGSWWVNIFLRFGLGFLLIRISEKGFCRFAFVETTATTGSDPRGTASIACCVFFQNRRFNFFFLHSCHSKL